MEKYKKEYEISSYECDALGELRLRSLFNLFQDLADKHADIMGVGYHFCIQRQIGWMGGYYHIQIEKMPVWTQKVILWTWPSKSTGVTGIREFELTDENENILVRATSQWVLVDTIKKRPVSVEKNIGSYELIEKRSIDSKFEKISPLEEEIMETFEIVREDDIDINNHVNNAVYPCWVLDALPTGYLENHSLKELRIQFRQSAQKGDSICVKTAMKSYETCHSIQKQNSDIEFARVQIQWQKR